MWIAILLVTLFSLGALAMASSFTKRHFLPAVIGVALFSAYLRQAVLGWYGVYLAVFAVLAGMSVAWLVFRFRRRREARSVEG